MQETRLELVTSRNGGRGRFLVFKDSIAIEFWIVIAGFSNNHISLLNSYCSQKAVAVEKSVVIGGGTIYVTAEVQDWYVPVLDVWTPLERRGPIADCLWRNRAAIRKLYLGT